MEKTTTVSYRLNESNMQNGFHSGSKIKGTEILSHLEKVVRGEQYRKYEEENVEKRKKLEKKKI